MPYLTASEHTLLKLVAHGTEVLWTPAALANLLRWDAEDVVNALAMLDAGGYVTLWELGDGTIAATATERGAEESETLAGEEYVPLEILDARPEERSIYPPWWWTQTEPDVRGRHLWPPRLLIGEGLCPWPPPPQKFPQSICPACKGRLLEGYEYCIRCDRWGHD